jgi:SRSO17 transposase
MQQFLADSPWDPTLLVRASAELIAPEIGVSAWIVDDSGIAKDGGHSPGVKRQYSGTLGKIGNCQITVSVHAVGARGTLPLGWRLYLPEDWCDDLQRRRKAKIPDAVGFQTKPDLAADVCEAAAGWQVPNAPILADCAYGDDTRFRTNLHAQELEHSARRFGEGQCLEAGDEVCRARADRQGRPEPVGYAARPQTRIGARARGPAA